ncbi:MAG: hypothetical protein N2250_07900 [Pseudothermotoga sp.]|nr:hypothetical protein [Pseudothermotoga sp.]
MRRSVLIVIAVFFWLYLILYFFELGNFKSWLNQIRESYVNHIDRLARLISSAYFQWDTVQQNVVGCRTEELHLSARRCGLGDSGRSNFTGEPQGGSDQNS